MPITLSEPTKDSERLNGLFSHLMKALFQQTGATLDIGILASEEAQDFIDTHAGVLNSGFEKVRMSDTMRRHLEGSNWIFSGIKTFHELNEAFPSLIDDNGNRKPFERFLDDVQKIDKTYNRDYLRAEYNYVQASAEMAAKWEKYSEDGDRYNLQYRTAGDERVRPAHAALNGITLPQSDSFWDKYYPPNGWNCRCTVVQVRKDKYPETPHDEAMGRATGATSDDKKGIFQFNSGKQQKAVPDYNAYTIRRCRDCDIAQGRVNLAFVPESELCQACKLIRHAQAMREKKQLKAFEFKTAKNKALEWARHNLTSVEINGVKARKDYISTSDGHRIGISQRFFNETAAKNKQNKQLVHVLKTATEFKKWLPDAGLVRVEKGLHHPCNFNVYRVQYQGQLIEFKTKVTTEELLYTMRIM